MTLSSKQKRLFTLAIHLAPGKPVAAKTISNDLECSGATLTRTMRELRDLYLVTIKFSKANNTYLLTDSGKLTKKELAHMAASLQKDAQIDGQDAVVSLTKQKKRTISVSLTRAAMARLDKSVRERHSNRSDTIEQLIHRYLDSLFQK